jgi:hypothetical protein
MLLWKAVMRVEWAALGCLALRWYFTHWPPVHDAAEREWLRERQRRRGGS